MPRPSASARPPYPALPIGSASPSGRAEPRTRSRMPRPSASARPPYPALPIGSASPSGRADSNRRYLGPKPSALAPGLRPEKNLRYGSLRAPGLSRMRKKTPRPLRSGVRYRDLRIELQRLASRSMRSRTSPMVPAKGPGFSILMEQRAAAKRTASCGSWSRRRVR